MIENSPAIIIFSLYWKRMNRNDALAGILVGGITVVIWKQLTGGIFDLYEIVPGFIFASLAIVIASLFSSGPTSKVTELFDRVEGRLAQDN